MRSTDSKASKSVELTLARIADAPQIGLMSRDLIEAGLPWSWNAPRVARNIRCPDTVVLAARGRERLVGFAIMQFLEERAHLNLLGVRPSHQRYGVGRRLVQWLEKSALTAGTPVINLEVRADNHAAQAFYRALGYREIVRMPRYYSGRETAVRMARDLWAPSPPYPGESC